MLDPKVQIDALLSALQKPLVVLPPLFVAVILHEIAHGLVAERLGDSTARRAGRITLNPLKHIDPFMTVFLPAFLLFVHSPIIFGGAKPVPVNPLYFKNPRRGMMLVALAGPLTNFILMGLSFLLLRVLEYFPVSTGISAKGIELVVLWSFSAIWVNLILGLFNLLPVPPLDGGRIAVGLLPLPFAKLLGRLEPYGLLILVVLLSSGIVDRILGPMIAFTFRLLFGRD